MRAATLLPLFAAAVFAQDSSSVTSVSLDFPQTKYLTQTDSRGVITGQPAVETSQPSVATSQPAQPAADTSQPPVDTDVGTAATIPAVGTGIITILVPGTAGPNSTATLVVSANNSTTIVLGGGNEGSTRTTASRTGTGSAEPTKTGEGDSEESGSPSGSGSGAAASSTGAASSMRAVAGSFVGLGAFVAAFL